MVPPKFETNKIWLEEDKNSTDFSEKKSKLEISGYTQYIDLLEIFASIRKTMGKRDSYSLDAILLEEIGESKYDYEGSIQEAAWINFEEFLVYSLYDSYRLYQLEEVNKDIDLLYNMGLMTFTRFSKVLTKTISIRNFAAALLYKEGFILSNNRNQFTTIEGTGEKFRGALNIAHIKSF